MFGSAVLEVAAGLIFIYLMLSIAASAISGKISEILLWRAKFLEKGLRELILGSDLRLNMDFVNRITEQFYNHPSIRALYRDKSMVTRWLEDTRLMGSMQGYVKETQDWVPPGKIEGKTFVLALLDLLSPGGDKPTTLESLQNTIKTAGPLQGTQIQQTLLTLIGSTEKNIEEARKNIEDWFDCVMEQITALYAKRMRLISFIIGLVVALVMNVDTIAVTNALWRNPTLRDSVSQAAVQFAETRPEAKEGKVPIEEINKQLQVLTLPIGWAGCTDCYGNIFGLVPLDMRSHYATPSKPAVEPFDSTGAAVWASVLKVLGWFVSGLAAAQGAPFWYDLLKKVTQREG